MLDSEPHSQQTQLRSAVDQALRSGLGADEIVDMVAEHVHTLKDLARDVLDGDPAEPEPAPSREVTYNPGELPPDLIDLPSAAKEYGISVKTLHSWVDRGKLPRCGRLRAPASGGGYVVTQKSAISYVKEHPRKRGRKKFADA